MRPQKPGCQLLGNLLEDISFSCDSGTKASGVSRLRAETVDHLTERNIELLSLEAKLSAEEALRAKARIQCAAEQNTRSLPPRSTRQAQRPNCVDGDVLVSKGTKEVLESTEVILSLLDNMSACCDLAFEKPVHKVRGKKREAASGIAAFVARIGKQDAAMRETKQKLEESRQETTREAMRFGQRYDSPNGVSTPSTHVPDTPAAKDEDQDDMDSAIGNFLDNFLDDVEQDEDKPDYLSMGSARSVEVEQEPEVITLKESTSLPNLRVAPPLVEDSPEDKEASLARAALNLAPQRKRARSLEVKKSPFCAKVEYAPRVRAPEIDFAAHLAEAALKQMETIAAREENYEDNEETLSRPRRRNGSPLRPGSPPPGSPPPGSPQPDLVRTIHPDFLGQQSQQSIHNELPRCLARDDKGVRYSILPDRRRMRKCMKFGMRYECDSPYCEGCNPLANLGVNAPLPLIVTGFEGITDVRQVR